MQPLECLAADGVIYVEIAMVIFLTVFLGIVLWVVLAKPGRFRDESRIPLDDSRPATRKDAGEEHDHVRA